MIPGGKPDQCYDWRSVVIQELEDLSEALGKVQDALQDLQERLGEILKVF